MTSINGDTWMMSPEGFGKFAFGTWKRYRAHGKMASPNWLVSSMALGLSGAKIRGASPRRSYCTSPNWPNPMRTPLPVKLPVRKNWLAFVGDKKKASPAKFALGEGKP